MKSEAAGLVLLLAAAAVGDRLREEMRPLRLPVGNVERGLASRLAEGLCVRKVAADGEWFGILQYAGRVEFLLTRGEELFDRALSATDADPRFVECYKYCGSVLMWECERPRQAVALLERGIFHNPENRWLPLYLAAIAYANGDRLEGVIETLSQLAFSPGAPFVLRRILANTYEKRGMIREAAAICVFVSETDSNERHRRWAMNKLTGFRRDHGMVIEEKGEENL